MVEPSAPTKGSESSPKTKKPRERSPNYPAVGLRKALELAQRFWDNDKRQSVMAVRAATNLGFTAKSSAGALALAAMKKYGLLDEEGSGEMRKLKLSESAVTILNPSASNRDELFKQAALKPSIHSELWTKYGLEGSDGGIHDYLVFERKFTEQAAKSLIEQYKDTLAFAKLAAADKIEDEIAEPSPSSRSFEAKPQIENGRSTPPAQTVNLIDIPVPLPSGVIAYYRLPSSMPEADFTFYQSVLTAYKGGLVKNAKQSVAPAFKRLNIVEFPAKAVWKSKDHDKPVTIIGVMGTEDDVAYFKTDEGTGIPETELDFEVQSEKRLSPENIRARSRVRNDIAELEED